MRGRAPLRRAEEEPDVVREAFGLGCGRHGEEHDRPCSGTSEGRCEEGARRVGDGDGRARSPRRGDDGGGIGQHRRQAGEGGGRQHSRLS